LLAASGFRHSFSGRGENSSANPRNEPLNYSSRRKEALTLLQEFQIEPHVGRYELQGFGLALGAHYGLSPGFYTFMADFSVNISYC
jgi:hypothetical protein